MYIFVQYKDAFDFITDAYLALEVYKIGRDYSEQVKGLTVQTEIDDMRYRI
jgi:hypothetical protein